MCGICMVLEFKDKSGCNSPSNYPCDEVNKCRGPDLVASEKIIDGEVSIRLLGSVLWLQGKSPSPQPFTDSKGNKLLWNGDILSGLQVPAGISDTELLSTLLGEETDMLSVLGAVRGPYAFIYYSKEQQRIYFGRDVFGRHSLLMTDIKRGSRSFMLTSVGEESCHDLMEVPALGLFYIDIKEVATFDDIVIHLIPWDTLQSSPTLQEWDSFTISTDRVLVSPIREPLNKALPQENSLDSSALSNLSLEEISEMSVFDEDHSELLQHMTTAVKRRVLCPECCKACTNTPECCTHCRVAVLFSGGVDSAILALLLDKVLPKEEIIDLINVAFPLKAKIETPIRKKNKQKSVASEGTSSLNENMERNSLIDDRKVSESTSCSSLYDVPDRITGRKCLQQLKELSPSRKWNFVEVDVSAECLASSRQSTIRHLLRPHCSVLDDSIGCALYWAAKGEGKVNGLDYISPARVVLCGLGADEQFAGYSRHRSVFSHSGYKGLLQEVQMELERLHHRNLGRDNRVIAHHARAPRYPFLDEDLVSFLNSLPIWRKCNLDLERGVGEKLLLRVLAHRLGLTYSSSLHKRAIQFGSRIAKMDNKKEKGNQSCERLK